MNERKEQRVVEQMQLNGFEFWSNRCMLEYWKFVQYVAVLDDSRLLKRTLTWNAVGGRRGWSFDMGCPCDKILQVVDFFRCSPGQSSLPDFLTCMHSLNSVRVSRTATVHKGHGKRIQSSCF